MGRAVVSLDFELAGVLDLTECGADVWTRRLDTVPILAGFAIDQEPPFVIGFDLLFGINILARADRAYIYANVAVSVAFFLPAIWLFRNLNFRKAGHPVIRLFINVAGGKQLLAATDFLNQIEEFKGGEQD